MNGVTENQFSRRFPAVPAERRSSGILRILGFAALFSLLIIPFQNFGPRPEDGIENQVEVQEQPPSLPIKKAASFVPHYRYDISDRRTGSVKLPDGYVPSNKMVYKSSSEDIPDEAWIKGMENRFLLKFDQDSTPEEELTNQRTMNTPLKGIDKDGKAGKTELPTAEAANPTQPKDKIIWQVIDRDGKGKFTYSGPVKVEANYNVSTGEGVLKVLHPLSKASQMSVEANSKNASETLNFNYSW